ncbi:hypothetical protein V5O48_015982 [Marasmius crinis-equi]|uniref:Uncharacterized protein n=1 Tax=Marasmius crinis-equi TaxID=585013 RepID=A0ABR3ESY5_9AGAR
MSIAQGSSIYTDRIALGSLLLSQLQDYRLSGTRSRPPSPRESSTVDLNHAATLLSHGGEGVNMAVSGGLHPHGASLLVLSSKPLENVTSDEVQTLSWRRYQRNEQESAAEILKGWHSRRYRLLKLCSAHPVRLRISLSMSSLADFIPDMITILTTQNPADPHEAVDQLQRTTCYSLRYSINRIRYRVALGHKVWQQCSADGLTTITGPAQIIRKWVAEHREIMLGLPYTCRFTNGVHARNGAVPRGSSHAEEKQLHFTRENVDQVLRLFTAFDQRVEEVFQADSSITERVYEKLYLDISSLIVLIECGLIQRIVGANKDLEIILKEAKVKRKSSHFVSPRMSGGVENVSCHPEGDQDEEDEEAASMRAEGIEQVTLFSPLINLALDPDVQLGQRYQIVDHYNSLCAWVDAVAHFNQHPIKVYALDLTVTEVQCLPPPKFVLRDELRREFEQSLCQKLDDRRRYQTKPEWLARLKNTLGRKLDDMSTQGKHPRSSYHAEALLMALANEYTTKHSAQDADTSAVLSGVFGNSSKTIPIGAPKGCCYLCWKLSGLLKLGPDRAFDLPPHRVHGVVYPWVPPIQLSEDVLKELWVDIREGILAALERHDPEPLSPLGNKDAPSHDKILARFIQLRAKRQSQVP